MGFSIEAGVTYPVQPFGDIDLKQLSVKQSLLPEGPDIARMSEEEIRSSLENSRSLDLSLLPLPLEDVRAPSNDYIEAVYDERQGEFWYEIDSAGHDVVAAKAIAQQRYKENVAFADRWILQKTAGLGALLLVLPDILAIDGSRVAIKGRYKKEHDEACRIVGSEATEDPNGWSIFASVADDFDKNQGTITLD